MGAVMISESVIIYETLTHWVARVPKGVAVYKIGVTHSTRCAFYGDGIANQIERAKKDADRRTADALELITADILARNKRRISGALN